MSVANMDNSFLRVLCGIPLTPIRVRYWYESTVWVPAYCIYPLGVAVLEKP